MAVVINDAASTRPSLFATISTVRATIRLAKVTAAFTRELKARVSRSRGDPLSVHTRRAFEDRAYLCLARVSKPLQSRRICREGAAEKDSFVELLNSLLKELDENSGIFRGPLSKIAADRRLFLDPAVLSSLKSTGSTSWAKAAYEYDLVTLLLRALGRRNELHDTERSVSCVEDLGTEILSNEVYAADLEHFLLCLQRRLFDALLRRSLNELEEKAIEWQKYWQQLRKLGSWWFFEWPSGRRPLSTTWPWNVKPSLMVLWGVCWMFYDEKPKSSIPADVFLGNDAFLEYMPQRMPWPDEIFVDLELNSTTVHPNSSNNIPISPRQGRRRGSFNELPSASLESDITAPQPPWNSSPGPESIYRHKLSTSNNNTYATPIRGRSPVEYISTSAPNTAFRTSEPLQHDFFQYDTAFASQGSGDFLSEFDASSSSFTNPQAESPFNPPLVTFQAPTPPDAGSLGTWNSLYNLNRPRDLERVSPFQPFHENISDVHNMHNNHQASDLRHNPDADSTEPRKRSATPVTPTDSLNQEVETSPTSMISGEPKDSDRGGSETPRNERNQLTCIHVDCASNAPIFLRRCEWRKHMDKHDRPYRCKSLGCEKLQGFTYSGGLLRHEREVHKKHGGPKERMMCPYPDCKRSSGVGFTRKENLNEHKRRVHRNSGDIKLEEIEGDGERSEEEVVEVSRKRRRSLVSELSVSAGEGGDGDDLRAKVFRLEEDNYVHAKKLKVVDDRLLATDNRLLGTESRLRASEETAEAMRKEMGELRRFLTARGS